MEGIFMKELGEAINISVGGDAASGYPLQNFQVFKNVICGVSPYFKAACDPKWCGDKSKAFPLEDADPEDFRLLIQWMHTGNFDYYGDGDPGDVFTDDDKCEAWVERLVSLYVMADRLQISELKDRIITELIATGLCFNISLYHIKAIWSNTGEGCLLRRLVLNLWLNADVHEGMKVLKKAHSPDLMPDFVVDVAMGLTDRLNRDFVVLPMEEVLSPHCTYHEHEKGSFCPERDCI
ncbi:MAG: hypothetical protein M1820_003152 [Bogoriella megaspora]|nr:MAG: hypothetical protein M1820_003152 [Bogoriella megaspora]